MTDAHPGWDVTMGQDPIRDKPWPSTKAQDRERWNPQAPAIYVGPRPDANRVGVIPKGELDRPICATCLRPGASPYCTRCIEQGHAARHAAHPHRRMTL